MRDFILARLWETLMNNFLLVAAALVLLSFPASAQMEQENIDELFERMEQMCVHADTEITRFVKFEGDAGARGVLKLVGAEVSGSVTIEQYENLEQKLNDFRTNPTICRFEAVKLLKPIFAGGVESDKQSALRHSIAYICNLNDEGTSHVRVNGRRDKLSRRARDLLNAFRFDAAKSFNKIYVSKSGETFYQNLNRELISTEPPESSGTRGVDAIPLAEEWGIGAKIVIGLTEFKTSRSMPILDIFGIDQLGKTKEAVVFWGISPQFDVGFEFRVRVFGNDNNVQDSVLIGSTLGKCQGVAT